MITIVIEKELQSVFIVRYRRINLSAYVFGATHIFSSNKL